MNRTTDNTTLLSCGDAFLPINPAKISPDLHAVFIVRIVVNALTCPVVILLNILVMVAVKTKRQLRTKSNVALACLATTDLMVGLVVQPLHIARAGLLITVINSQQNMSCNIADVSKGATLIFVMASLHHFVLMCAERYMAVKHPFAYENHVTEVRIIIASGLAWATAIIISTDSLLPTTTFLRTITAVSVTLFILLPVIAFFNVTVYMEVRRQEKQIAANQVSLEAKEKILKNKKAFYTTTVVLLVIFLCYTPLNICIVILKSLKDRIAPSKGHITIYLLILLPVLNSLFNPLIYAVRIRYFRVAFIQLLSRKTVTQAEELERKIFGPRQNGVIANVEKGQNRADREDEQLGNWTLNNGNETTVRTQPQQAHEETPL